jgi:hypothetical protein
MATQALIATTSLDYAAGTVAMVRAGSVFDTVAELKPYREPWLQRCARYQILRAYYAGRVYDQHPELVKALKLYSGIRQIFGPLRRAVRVDVAKVPGDWSIDPGNEDGDRPAVPRAVADAVRQVRAWSKHRASYTRAVMHGAVAGEFGLLVVDDWRARTVQIVPLRPDEVVLGTFGDGTPFGLVIKTGLVDRQGVYEYAQLITPRTISTYRNGTQHDYDGGGAERSNLLGFVPLLLSPYIAGEDGVGENAFAGAQELLDRVNDAASQALDVIQRNAEPLTVFSGVSEVDFNPEHNAVVLNDAAAKAYTVAPNLVIDHALQLIDKVLSEFKNILPQLLFDQLISRNDLAYDTVITLLSELIDHVQDARTHVDMAIETAERWALLAGQAMGVFPASLDPALHQLDPDRPVIKPPPSQRLALEAQRVGVAGAQRALTAPDERPRAPLDDDDDDDDAPRAGVAED